MMALLRIVFVALAIVFGIGLASAAVLGVLDLFQPPGADALDGPPPFSFSSYAYTPILAVIVFLSGFAALQRHWDVLVPVCWFILGAAVLEALYAILIFALQVPVSSPDAAGAVLALFAILGLVLATRARSHAEPVSDPSQSAAAQERIRLRNTLVGLAVVSYLWRAVSLALNPGAASAIAYLRGTSEAYLTLSSGAGLGAAVLLVICVIASFKGSDKVLHAALAFAAGLAFEGFLDTLDAALGFETVQMLRFSLQDAIAFIACCAALALSTRAERSAPRVTAA